MRRIKDVYGREILDSRGNPTVEAVVILNDGTVATGMVPSGASTGEYEALELRDGGTRYGGKGVQKAVKNIDGPIRDAVVGLDVTDIYTIDRLMIEADGTKEKKKLDANSILAVSLACSHAAAKSLNIPLYRFLGGAAGTKLPRPMMNILNGGAHADNNVDIQEFMILPTEEDFTVSLEQCANVFHTLKALLKSKGLSTAVGDEGGFAPNLSDDTEAIELILQAVEKAGYKVGQDFNIALDAAASEWKTDKGYLFPKKNKEMTVEELVSYWEKLVSDYPIVSIEDPLGENDWDAFTELTKRIGDKIMVVGDDLFVTNPERLVKGIELNAGNSILIKLNQIGSVSETLKTIRIAQDAGFNVIVSHRSGETEDTTISDLAVATNAGFIKTGAPSRGERVAKYNRLLRIADKRPC